MIHETLPTGSVAVDVALGIGGWPRGHVVEVRGDTGTGKTTLGLLACRSAQRAGDEAAFIDVDHTFDPRYAARLGVAVPRLVVAQPPSAEHALGIARILLRTGAVTVLVLDSAAALVPAAELAAPVGAADPAVRRRLCDRGLRDLAAAAARRAVVVATNRPQMCRDREGAWRTGSAAGDALPQVAAVRLELSHVAASSETTRVRAAVTKNALCGNVCQARQTDVVWRWDAGVDRGTDLLVAAFDLGVITARAGVFWFDGARLGALDDARAALCGDTGARVAAAIFAAAPWRRPASLTPLEALVG